MNNQFTLPLKKGLFFTLFTLLSFLALQVSFTSILGTEVRFSLYHFLAPLSASFFGIPFGIAMILITQLTNSVFHGAALASLLLLLRLPTLASTLYFAKKDARILLIPIACFITFNLHPVGREAAAYSLFWIIPIVCHFFRDRSLFARSLGTTFTAHAVGSIVFLYCFDMTAQMWLSLIPVVILERLVFSMGIAGSFVALKRLQAYLKEKQIFEWIPAIR